MPSNIVFIHKMNFLAVVVRAGCRMEEESGRTAWMVDGEIGLTARMVVGEILRAACPIAIWQWKKKTVNHMAEEWRKWRSCGRFANA